MTKKQRFPKILEIGGSDFILRLMTPQDRSAILSFAQHLPEADLQFMRRDVTQADAVDAWLRDVETGRAVSLIAEADGGIVGYGTLYFNQLFWNRHLGEVRVLVSSAFRNRGLGKRIVRELITLAREKDLEKVVTYMSVGDASARSAMEDLGFQPEAILGDWVKTRDNRHHDLLIMSTSLTDFQN